MENEKLNVLNRIMNKEVSLTEGLSLLSDLFKKDSPLSHAQKDSCSSQTGPVQFYEKTQQDGSEKKSLDKKFLKIQIEFLNSNQEPEKIDLQIPLALLKSGFSLLNWLPVSMRTRVHDLFAKRGIELNLDQMNDKCVQILAGLSLDLNYSKEKIKIFCD